MSPGNLSSHKRLTGRNRQVSAAKEHARKKNSRFFLQEPLACLCSLTHPEGQGDLGNLDS